MVNDNIVFTSKNGSTLIFTPGDHPMREMAEYAYDKQELLSKGLVDAAERYLNSIGKLPNE
jgi:hypothetical protein